VGLIFGVLIEILQDVSGLGRTAEIRDILADLAGIIFATGVLFLLSKRKQITGPKD
jgi:hypothetical protein